MATLPGAEAAPLDVALHPSRRDDMDHPVVVAMPELACRYSCYDYQPIAAL